jgi:hypothetical protein
MEKHHVKGLNLPFVLLICLAVNFHANAQKSAMIMMLQATVFLAK